jgi:hypothetical protein
MQPLITNYDNSQIFLGDNFFTDADYTNNTGSTVNLSKGRLMGRTLATNQILEQVSAATDGSEFPMGILAEDISVAAGDTVTTTICTGGDVNAEKLIQNGAETLATIVRTASTGGGTVGDLIRRNTTINLIASRQLSAYDNQ